MSEDHEVRSTVGLVIRDPALVLGILASVFLFFSMLLFPVFGILVGLFTPLPLLYFYYQRGRTIGLVMIGLATLVVGIIFFMDSNVAGGLMFLGYGLLVVVMAESLRFSLPPEKVIGYPAAALLGLGLAVLIVSSTFHGQSPWAYGRSVIKTHVEETFKIYQDILTAAQQSRAPSESDQAEDRSGITGEDDGRKMEAEFPSAAPDEEFGKLASLFVRIFPGLMIIGVLLLAWINFMAVRWLLAWKGVLPHHLADLKKWKAPEVLIWGVILFGFCVVLPIEASRSIGLNGLMVLALIYFFAGLSVVAYWFDLKAVLRFFRVITYMIIALQQYLGLIIVGLGLFDLWFDFRRLKKGSVRLLSLEFGRDDERRTIMKVILTTDVEALGLAGQIVDVSRGYARNKLIPGQLAVETTPGNLKVHEKARTEFEVRSLKEKERAEQIARQIEKVFLTMAQKAGEKDKLYGSVTSMDLARAMAEQGLEIDRRRIKLAEPIKTLGDYEIPIRLHSEVTAVIKVSVVRTED